MKAKIVIASLFLAAMTCLTKPSSAQTTKDTVNFDTGDSLSLPFILERVMESYPSIIRAQQAIKAAEAGIGLAASGYYPNIIANAGYTRIGPVPDLTIPDLGHFSLAPNNNYNGAVSVYQNVYDFEKTARSVELEKSNKELSEKNVELVKQKLTLLTSVSYYMLIYLQEAIKIKDAQIETLQKHLDFITLKEQTGSAIQYEVLSTKVRLSNARNQKVDLETSRQTQQAILNSLMGISVKTPIRVKEDFITSRPEIPPDSLIVYALDHRYEMAMARLKEKNAQLYLRSAKVMDNPTLSVFATGGIKNGYIPDLNKLTPNYAAGISFVVPIFNATRLKNTVKIANSQIDMSRSDIEKTARDISTEVYQNETSLLASQEKIDQGSLQVNQAEDALDLAAVSFKSGAITNLDMLDAETALEESRVNLLRARVEYAINLVRLNISVGRPIQ